jgi:hypothetical protein
MSLMRAKEEVTFFEKKVTKKPFGPAGGGTIRAKTRSKRKFFASFFQKRSASFLNSFS